jgi:hypothetical protein
MEIETELLQRVAGWAIVAAIVAAAIGILIRRITMTDAGRATQRQKSQDDAASRYYGPINEYLVCPHCQMRGHVRCKHITARRGVSGTKAAAALLTGGASLLTFGLSRKEGATRARCGNCQSEWTF